MNQIEAGIEQFEWAIKLYLNEKAYIPAITLAGAAEGIFGEMEDGFIFHTITERVSQKIEQPTNVKYEYNKIRNYLKHANKKTDVQFSNADLKANAISRILMCAAALIHIQPNYMSNLLTEFIEHTRVYNPDFLSNEEIK